MDVVFEDESSDGSRTLVLLGDLGENVDEVSSVIRDGFERGESLW